MRLRVFFPLAAIIILLPALILAADKAIPAGPWNYNNGAWVKVGLPDMDSPWEWQPGYWNDVGNWVPGQWKMVEPSNDAAVWVAGHWDDKDKWVAGRWEELTAPKGKKWVPGYWRNGRWVPGRWSDGTRPNPPGKVWVPPHWAPNRRWIPGHWATKPGEGGNE